MKTNSLSSGNIIKQLSLLAIPNIIVLIANFGVLLADMFFVSQLGTVQLTAMGFVFPIIEIIIGVALGLGIASMVVIGRLVGANNLLAARQYLSVALIISLSVGLLLSAVGYLSIELLFKDILGATPIVYSQIWAYLKIWYLGLPFLLLLITLSFSSRAYGEVYVSSGLFALAAILNLILDPIFIFGLLGFPRLAITGAGLASFISYLAVFLIYFTYIYRENLVATPSLKKGLAYSKEMFAIFIPASMANFIPPISIAITVALLADISQSAVAAFGIASRIQMFSIIPLLVISGSISPIISQSLGAAKIDRIHYTLKLSLLACLVWGISVAILLFAIKSPLTLVFTDVPQVASISELYFMIVPISYIGWGMIMMYSSYFNAIGKPYVSMMIALLRMMIIYIPLALLLRYYFSTIGIFIALVISNFAVAIGALIYNSISRPQFTKVSNS